MGSGVDLKTPLILGLETSTHSGGAALLAGEPADINLRGSVCFTTKALYSQRLLPSIQWLLERSETALSDVTTIGISVGPGSFTGLRIGLSVAKALAYASGAQIIGVGTLEALAVRASGGRDALVCPLLDARQGQVYGALYQVSWIDSMPLAEIVHEEWAGPVEEIADWITGPTLFAGDALPLARLHLQSALADKFLLPPPHQRLPHPDDVALLAAARAAAGQIDNPMSLEPRYVRQSYTQRTKPKLPQYRSPT